MLRHLRNRICRFIDIDCQITSGVHKSGVHKEKVHLIEETTPNEINSFHIKQDPVENKNVRISMPYFYKDFEILMPVNLCIQPFPKT